MVTPCYDGCVDDDVLYLVSCIINYWVLGTVLLLSETSTISGLCPRNWVYYWLVFFVTCSLMSIDGFEDIANMSNKILRK